VVSYAYGTPAEILSEGGYGHVGDKSPKNNDKKRRQQTKAASKEKAAAKK
jgi:hypothetical protein